MKIIKKQSLGKFPTRMKLIKVDIRTWDELKHLKQSNETFNDVINRLIEKRTKSLGNKDIQAIKYQRKSIFFTSYSLGTEIGYQFEYNDVKGEQSDFALDIKLKKIFYGKKILNPSEFFGVDNAHKHYSKYFLIAYLKAAALILEKEFKAKFEYTYFNDENYENIALWRKFYYEYNLSEESFISDIQEPLRLSEDEKIPKNWQYKINNSISKKLDKKQEKSNGHALVE